MNYTFDQEEKMFYVEGKSEIDYSDIKKFLQDIVEEYPDVKNIFMILDYTKSDFNFEDSFIVYTIYEVTELINQLEIHFREIYAAHIVQNKTKSGVLIEMFSKQKFENSHFHIEIFNDRQSGKEWLLKMQKATG
jgi:hypothetical protein